MSDEMLNGFIEGMKDILEKAKNETEYRKVWKLYELKGYLLETLRIIEKEEK